MRAIAVLAGVALGVGVAVLGISLLAGGDSAETASEPAVTTTAGSATGSAATSPSGTTSTIGPVDISTTYDPVAGGEPVPQGFRQLLRRDQIAPIYDPEFVPAPESSWRDDALIIGVEIDGESKAYPVGFLNRREMVIDRLSGVPILVTW